MCYVSLCFQTPLNTYKHKKHRGNNFGTSHYERQRSLSKHSAVAQTQRFVTRKLHFMGVCVTLLSTAFQIPTILYRTRYQTSMLRTFAVLVGFCLFVCLACFVWGVGNSVRARGEIPGSSKINNLGTELCASVHALRRVWKLLNVDISLAWL